MTEQRTIWVNQVEAAGLEAILGILSTGAQSAYFGQFLKLFNSLLKGIEMLFHLSLEFFKICLIKRQSRCV